MKLALVSFNPKWKDIQTNIKKIIALTRKAHKSNANLVIFPEMSLTGFACDSSSYVALEKIRELISKLPEIDVVLGAGVTINDKFYNKILWCNNKQIQTTFDKLHAFSLGNEKHITLGNRLNTHIFNGIQFGFGICYDLRFSETFLAKCDAFIVVACWPKSRITEWKTLLLARAIETQSIVIGVNRSGKEANNDYVRSSLIALPDGTFMKPRKTMGVISIYDIDFDKALQRRNIFNTVQDKRYDLYASL